MLPLLVPAYDTILAFRLPIDRLIGNLETITVKALLAPRGGGLFDLDTPEGGLLDRGLIQKIK